jgi:hypothetical protein
LKLDISAVQATKKSYALPSERNKFLCGTLWCVPEGFQPFYDDYDIF